MLAHGKTEGFVPEHASLGFLVAWVYCSWFSPSLFSQTGRFTQNDVAWLVSICASVATIFAVSLLLKEKSAFASKFSVPFAAGGSCLGTLLVSAAAGPWDGAPAVSIGGSVLTGVASGLLYVLISERVARFTQTTVRLIATVTAAITLCCYIVSSVLPLPFSAVFSALLPVCSGILLTTRDRSAAPDENLSAAPPAVSDEKCAALIRKVFAIVALTSAMAAFCWATGPITSVIGGSPATIFIGGLLGILLTLVVSLRCLLLEISPNVAQLYRVLIPSMVLSMALLVNGTPLLVQLAEVLLIAQSMGLDFFVLLYFGSFLSKRFSSPKRALCYCEAFVNLGIALGNGSGLLVLMLLGGDATFLQNVYLAMMVAASVVLIVVVEQQGNIAKMAVTQSHRDAYAALALRFGLTEREVEVLELLAQGRSMPFISDELFISRSTVETHRKHIYAKLGIHNRQELIDVVKDELQT